MTKRIPLDEEDFLAPEKMIWLYSVGAFPMAEGRYSQTVRWYMPETRTVILPDQFHIPRSLRKYLSTAGFEHKTDTDLLGVLNGCASRPETWISERLIAAYKQLFEMGFLHTVETYYEGKLVGGLYGISYRGAFFGESMFSYRTQASKAALAHLLHLLKEKDFSVLDVQYITPHLKMFGAKEITLAEFNIILQKAYLEERTFK